LPDALLPTINFESDDEPPDFESPDALWLVNFKSDGESYDDEAPDDGSRLVNSMRSLKGRNNRLNRSWLICCQCLPFLTISCQIGFHIKDKRPV